MRLFWVPTFRILFEYSFDAFFWAVYSRLLLLSHFLFIFLFLCPKLNGNNVVTDKIINSETLIVGPHLTQKIVPFTNHNSRCFEYCQVVLFVWTIQKCCGCFSSSNIYVDLIGRIINNKSRIYGCRYEFN